MSFAEIGRTAARDAQRSALLDALVIHRWNLSAVARHLEMGDSANVRRAIDALELTTHYETAKAQGLIKPGRPAGDAGDVGTDGADEES